MRTKARVAKRRNVIQSIVILDLIRVLCSFCTFYSVINLRNSFTTEFITAEFLSDNGKCQYYYTVIFFLIFVLTHAMYETLHEIQEREKGKVKKRPASVKREIDPTTISIEACVSLLITASLPIVTISVQSVARPSLAADIP